MWSIIAICLLISAGLCIVLVVGGSAYILYVIQHRSSNVGFAITIVQNILKRKLLVPLIILLRFHLPFPIMLILLRLTHKTEAKSSSTDEERTIKVKDTVSNLPDVKQATD